MILVNKKQISLNDLAKVLKITIPLDKILKKPLFEINPAFVLADRANGPGAVKHRNSMDFPAAFYAQLSNGDDVEIRYCTNRMPDPKTNGNSEKFSPKSVTFDGKAEFISDDKDKAVYFWLHLFCKTSPFKKEGIPHEYELVDDTAKANALIAQLTLKGKATSHAAALDNDELVIVAKGMDIPGASTMDLLTIKASLMQFASDKPAEYLNKADSRVNHIRGLIMDAVDKGIFVIEDIYNSKRWKWGMGEKAGEVIVEMASSVANDRESLITAITNRINEFLPTLIDISKTLNAKANLAKAAEHIDVLAELKKGNKAQVKNIELNNAGEGNDDSSGKDDDHNNDDDFKDDPNEEFLPLPGKTFKEATEYLGIHIGKKTPALASALWKGIEDGSINEENIAMKLEEFKAQ